MDRKIDSKKTYRAEELSSVLEINLYDLLSFCVREVLPYECTADGLEISGTEVLKYFESKKSCTHQALQ